MNTWIANEYDGNCTIKWWKQSEDGADTIIRVRTVQYTDPLEAAVVFYYSVPHDLNPTD